MWNKIKSWFGWVNGKNDTPKEVVNQAGDVAKGKKRPGRKPKK